MSQEYVVHRDDAEAMLPGRTIHPEGEALRRADRRAQPVRGTGEHDDGWVQRNWNESEFEQRREGVVEDKEYDAAREWLRHVEAGRIGG